MSPVVPFIMFIVSYAAAMFLVDRFISDPSQTPLLAPVIGTLLALAIALWWRHGPHRSRLR